jgi:hypothetical protein
MFPIREPRNDGARDFGPVGHHRTVYLSHRARLEAAPMIPKYPYRVEHTYDVGKGAAPVTNTSNFEGLDQALDVRDKKKREPRTRTIRVLMVVDEWSK